MIYIFDVELPKNKKISYALLSIYGLGTVNTRIFCKKLGFSKNLTVNDLSTEQFRDLVKCIECLNPLISNDLLKIRLLTFEKLVSIKLVRALRKNQGLPVRGQRTHTNAKTAKRRLY